MKYMVLVLGVVIGVVSCAGHAELTSGGRMVKLMKSDPDSGCTEVGSVDAVGASDEYAKNAIRNSAAEKGANYVRLETIEGYTDGSVRRYVGSAFKCSN